MTTTSINQPVIINVVVRPNKSVVASINTGPRPFLSLGELTNVDTSGASNNNVLTFNSSTNMYEVKPVANTTLSQSANATSNGFLTSTDWVAFNLKQKAITYGTSAPSGGADGDIYLQYT